MRRKILLTGGTGFLGSRICRTLVERGDKITLLKRSFSDTWRIKNLLGDISCINLDESSLENSFQKFSPFDAVIHCATDYGRKNIDITQLIDANLILPLRLLKLSAKHGTRVFLNSDTILNKRVNEYSLSKKQFVEWLQFFSDGLSCYNICLEHFYGPEDDQTKFVSSIISQFLTGVENIALTHGIQKRDFIFIDDVVSAYLAILESALAAGPGFSTYQVGSGNSIDIRSFVLEIQSMLTESTSIPCFGALPYRENEVMESTVDLKPLLDLGWKPEISLREGLMRTVLYEKGRLNR